MPSIFESPAFQDTLFFPSADPSEPPPGAVDRFLEVPGARLRVRVHGADRERALVCFLGNGEHAGHYDAAGGALGALGYAIAFADYRGYGKSSGTPTFPLLIDDARAVVAALARDWPRMVLFGRSLGSQAVLHALTPPPLGIVIDSGFSDLDAFVARRGLSPAAITAEDRDRYDVLVPVRAYQGPILGLHGAADQHIKPADGRAIVEASRHPGSRFVGFEGAGHNDLARVRGYESTLAAWLHAL